MENQISLKDIKGLIRRRSRIFCVVFSLILFAAIFVAFILPPIYESQTVILIEEQQIPQDYVKSTITTYAEERLDLITRQIMKQGSLKEIVKKYNLYPELRKHGSIGDAVFELKDNIVLETISSKQGDKTSTVAFTLSYEGKDPRTVQNVTSALADLYLLEEHKAREKLVSVTTDFLKEELDSIKKQVKYYEEQNSKFKSKHLGELPENAAVNMQNVGRLERELERIDTRIRTLEDRKIYLKGQLTTIDPLKPVQTAQGKLATNPKERLKGMRLDLIRLQSRLSNKHPDIRKLKAEIAKLEAQVGQTDEAIEKVKMLRSKKAQLAELKGRLGKKHPDVRILEGEVNALARQVDNLITDKSMLEASENKPDNPIYINLMTQIAAADSEIKNLQKDEQNIEKDLKELRRRVANEPVIEKEYKELTRDYLNAKNKYNEIFNKLMNAEVAQQMEEQQRGEKFIILDPAYLPSGPSKPNRIAIVLLGFVLACGGGFIGSVLQESMDHTLKNEEDLAKMTGLSVLTTFSMVETKEELRVKRFKTAAVLLSAFGILAIILIAIDMFAIPLSELVVIIRDRVAI